MAKLTTAHLRTKQAQLAHTLTVERWETLPMEMEIKLKALNSWGFDLVQAERGQSRYFLVEADACQAGDTFFHDGEAVKIDQVLSQLPKNTRLTLVMTSEDYQAQVEALFWQEGEQTPRSLFKLPAVEVLLALCKKNNLGQLLAQVHSVGVTTEIVKKHGESGKTVPFADLPPQARRVLRMAKDILRKRVPAGRFELSWFGENKDAQARYQASLLIPTLSLLNVQVANGVDKLFAELTP